MGPDGYCYVANNGGFSFTQRADGRWVTTGTPDDYVTGRIERVNIETGKCEVLYDKVDGHNIRGPERSRHGRARRLLVHRSRQDAPSRLGSRQRVLRASATAR